MNLTNPKVHENERYALHGFHCGDASGVEKYNAG
jgi:hypothetical protein